MKKLISFFRENVQKICSSCCSWLKETFNIWHLDILNLNKESFISYNNTLFNNRSYTKQALLGGMLCALLIPGNLFSQNITVDGNPSDWGPVLGAGSTVLVKTHVRDANDTNDSQFTGGSQDPDLISEWSWSLGNTNDKGDISNAAATIIDNKLYFAGDRTAINGDAQIGFWFLLGGVAPVNGGTFSGTHVNGDLLALSNFTNGGGAVQIRLYRWTNGALAFVGTYNNAMVNSSPVFAPTAQVPAWTYQGKKLGSTTPAPNQYLTGAFFEGFIDLGDINIPDHCFQTFLLETRNSASVDASLQDLVENVFRAKPENPIVVGATRCGPGSVTLSVTCSDPALITRWYENAQGGGPIPAPDTSNVTQDATYYVTCYNAQLNCESDRVPISIDIIDSPNAGDDGSTTVCETNANPINLFTLISGEQPGGTWVRSTGTGGSFDAAAGTFTPAIGATNSTFTYTIIGVAPCPNDSSVATVNINTQPNAGDDGSTAVCADSVTIINLFNLISGEQPGGTWVRSSGSGGTFDAAAGTFTPGPGVTASTFTYTLTAISPCVDDSSVATVNINPLPIVYCPENAAGPVLCGVTQAIAQTQANSDFQAWLNQFAGLNPGLNSDYEITPSFTYSAGATPPNVGDAPLILAFSNPAIISTSVTVQWTVSNKNTGCINSCSATFTLEFGCAVQCIATPTHVLCNGAATGSISVVPTGGALPYNVYLYKLPDLATPVAQVLNILTDGVPIPFNNLTAGNYVAITTDATTTIENGSACTATINQPSAVQASDSHTDVLCNGGSTGSITLNFSGGTGPYMVNFNGGGFASQVSGVVYSNLAAGNYPWVVRDANNCIYEGSEQVGQPSALQASDSHSDVLCNGGSTGSITLNFSGGTGPYMVNFNGGGFASQVSGVVYSNLAAGNYPWVVRDANNCIYEGSEQVGQPSALQASDSHSDVLCNGGSTGSITLNFSGGTGPYMVNFNGGGFASQVSGVVYSNLAAGNYPWVVRDANNCIYEGSEQVGQPSALQASDSHSDVLCNGGSTGSITLNFSGGTGPYMVNFNGGGFASQVSGVVYSNLAAGNYPWVVRDANNCIYEGSEQVGQPSALQASDSHSDVLCNGGSTGSITLNFSGGTGPYMVNFNGGGFASQVSGVVYSNLAAGNYPWVVRDANNCIYEGSEQVGQPSALQASDSHSDVLCNGGSTGSITLNFSGGTGPYMVNFNGGGFASQVSGVVYSNLAAGNYPWVVRDANNCIYEGSEQVGQPSALQASDSHSDVLCNGGSTGSITLNFSGGTGPYMVNFNGGGFASQVSGVVYSNLAAGNYPWVVRDANNCIYEGSEQVGQPSALQASDSHSDVLCNGGSTGSITLNFSGGTGPYMVNFNGGGFASQVSGVVYSNLAAGNYPWVVRDANNCIYEGSEQVGQPTQVELSLTAEPENCTGTNTGSITATFSGGSGGYTINIDGGQFVPATSPHVFSNLGAGLHTVVVLDRNDCRDSAEIRVSSIPCDGPHCTYTQGYYGAYNGSACTVEGAPTNDYLIMLDAITDVGGTFDFGRMSTGNYFRLFSSDITGAASIANNKIFIMLPGGGTPRALVGYDYYDNPAGVPSSWRNDSNPLTKSGPKMGAINNNLLSQTMTLFFNTHVDPTLLSFALEVKFATQDVACGSNVPIPDTYKEFSIPASVINYLTSHGGATVGNLFNLANDALGGVNIGGLTHSDVNKAVDAINNAFDQCRVKVPLQTPPPTLVFNATANVEPVFTVYPVPFRDQLTIKYQFEDISKAKIDIYNSTGTLLMTQDDNDAYFNKEVTITPKFSVGEAQLYFIKVTTDKGQSVLKIISEK